MKHSVVDTFVPQWVLAGFASGFEAVTFVVVGYLVGPAAGPVVESAAVPVPEFAAAGSVVAAPESAVLVVGVVVGVGVVVVAAVSVPVASSSQYFRWMLQLQLQGLIWFGSG